MSLSAAVARPPPGRSGTELNQRQAEGSAAYRLSDSQGQFLTTKPYTPPDPIIMAPPARARFFIYDYAVSRMRMIGTAPVAHGRRARSRTPTLSTGEALASGYSLFHHPARFVPACWLT